jgi:hypothetical protein
VPGCSRFAAVREPGVMSTTGHERQQAALRGKLSSRPSKRIRELTITLDKLL